MPRLPEQLLNTLKSFDHFSEADFIEAHQEVNKITSIRLNPFKKADLDFSYIENVPWNPEGFYLQERPSFTQDPLFHAGCYYVQEAGSMFLDLALKQTLDFNQNLNILDACAAPGGKSTLINSLMNERSLLVCNEIIKSRADVLAQNLSKWGTCNTVVTNSDPSKFRGTPGFFDAIVIDAPCSGSGLFRKQPDAIDEWSEEHVMSCSVRQRKITEELLPALKEQGVLIYSTCSYSPAENEEVVAWLINNQGMEYEPLTVDNTWGVVETQYGFRFYPHLAKSEGFFCAVLRKRNESEKAGYSRKKNDPEITKNELALFSDFIKSSENKIIKVNTQFHLVNESVKSFLQNEKQLYFKKAGVALGELKGKDVIPNHELALSIHLSENADRVDVSREQAIQYLKKENFLPGETRKGFSLITYKKMGIGWAKILPNRINNYLPNELRILK